MGALSKAIAEVRCICTATELEALLLEDCLIKQYLPPFNKRQKKFRLQAYIEQTDEEFPRLKILDTYDPEGDEIKARYGPYADAFYSKDLIVIAEKYLGVRSFGLAQVGYERGGNIYPWRQDVRNYAADYAGRLELAAGFLLGDVSMGIDRVESRIEMYMELCSRRREFESAAQARDDLAFCTWHKKWYSFFLRFMTCDLKIEEVDRSGARISYMFRKGVLENAPEFSQTSDPEPAWRLHDRCRLVYAWLRSRRTRKSFRFLGEWGAPISDLGIFDKLGVERMSRWRGTRQHQLDIHRRGRN